MKILKINCCNECINLSSKYIGMGYYGNYCILTDDTLHAKDIQEVMTQEQKTIEIPESCPLEDFKQEKV